MDPKRAVLGFAEAHGVAVVSDGDLDGIAASAVLLRFLSQNGFSVDEGCVEFPHPSEVAKLELSDVFVVELAPTRGYRVVGDVFLIDHHGGFCGFKLLTPSGEEVVYQHPSQAFSVLRLLVEALGVSVDERVVEAIDLVDVGKTSESLDAQVLHRAYLLHIEDQGFRKKLFFLLLRESYEELWSLAEEEAKRYQAVSEEAKKAVLDRAEALERAAYTWYRGDSFERVCFREAMLELEESYDLVVVAKVREGGVEALHLGTKKELDVQQIIPRVLEELKKLGVEATGGGKREAGGIQLKALASSEVVESALRRALSNLS